MTLHSTKLWLILTAELIALIWLHIVWTMEAELYCIPYFLESLIKHIVKKLDLFLL